MDLSDDQLRAIGIIATRAAGIEALVKILLRWLIHPTDDNIGATLMGSHPFAWCLARSRELVPLRIRDPALSATVLQFVSEAKACGELRNKVLHSALWQDDAGNVYRLRFVPGPDEIQIELTSMEAGKLDEIAQVLERVHNRGREVVIPIATAGDTPDN